MRQKNLIFLVLVILLVGAAAGAVWYFGFYAPKQPAANLNQPTPGPAVSPGEEVQLSEEANYQPNPEEAFRYFLNLAMKYRQRAYCTKVVDISQQETCYKKIDEFLMGDPQIVNDCGKIGDLSVKIDCFENLAIKTENIAVCGNLDDVAARSTCKYTYVYAKINSGNIDLCQELQPAEQGDCFDIIYLNQASVSGNKDVCNNIKDENKKATCLGGAF